MNILMAYFSRTGHTEKLAEIIGDELKKRGHSLTWEVIRPAVKYSWLREIAIDFPRYPSIGCSIFSSRWRDHHIRTYNQVEEDIQTLEYPDVSGFDRICVGGPKWGQISYPVARYLKTIHGIHGKQVGSFATFGGPPFKTFEIELIEKPVSRLLERMGAQVVATVYVSSAYHEAHLMPLFRLLSLIGFGRPIEHFMLGSDYANAGIQMFCNDLLCT
ncbi:MAG TPA: hypothetical protein PKY89_14680 [Deltaproteobacteria bacterium]|nr:hypothetical protein [Deltaproteobacteria bacterium]